MAAAGEGLGRLRLPHQAPPHRGQRRRRTASSRHVSRSAWSGRRAAPTSPSLGSLNLAGGVTPMASTTVWRFSVAAAAVAFIAPRLSEARGGSPCSRSITVGVARKKPCPRVLCLQASACRIDHPAAPPPPVIGGACSVPYYAPILKFLSPFQGYSWPSPFPIPVLRLLAVLLNFKA